LGFPIILEFRLGATLVKCCDSCIDASLFLLVRCVRTRNGTFFFDAAE